MLYVDGFLDKSAYYSSFYILDETLKYNVEIYDTATKTYNTVCVNDIISNHMDVKGFTFSSSNYIELRRWNSVDRALADNIIVKNIKMIAVPLSYSNVTVENVNTDGITFTGRFGTIYNIIDYLFRNDIFYFSKGELLNKAYFEENKLKGDTFSIYVYETHNAQIYEFMLKIKDMKKFMVLATKLKVMG